MAKQTKVCAQCSTPFEAKSTVHLFCSRSCQLDARSGRPREQSANRKATGFAWEPIHRPRRVTIQRSAGKKSGAWKTAVLLPDPQIGYRRLDDGTLDPFHDEEAIDVALQVLNHERPDVAIWLGDFLDFAPFGRFRQEAGFAQTIQPAIEYGYELLAKTVALSGEVRLIEGNHDARLQNYITDNALASAGLRCAKSGPDSWPVLSVPYLLRLDELGVEYVGGYPAGATYLNDNFAAIHGHKVKSSGSTAAELTKDEQVSVAFGHIHRQETHHKTRNSRGKPRVIVAHSPGCLCRIDGGVPSVKSAIAMRTGRPVRSFEDWQQGVTVVRYETTGEQRFALEPIHIGSGFALHRGIEFTSRERAA